MDQAAQRAIVETEAGGAIEPQQAGTAKGAYAFGIQSETVLERRITQGAEEIGFERLRRIQASVANRYARKSGQGGVANAALGGEKERKNSVGDRLEAGSGRSR